LNNSSKVSSSHFYLIILRMCPRRWGQLCLLTSKAWNPGCPCLFVIASAWSCRDTRAISRNHFQAAQYGMSFGVAPPEPAVPGWDEKHSGGRWEGLHTAGYTSHKVQKQLTPNSTLFRHMHDGDKSFEK
jgi:hypothetical protein